MLEDQVRKIVSALHSLYAENVDIRDDPRIKALQKAIRILKKAYPTF